MSGLKRGILFSKLAFQAAFKLPSYLKSVGTYFLGVLVLIIIAFIPIGAILIFLGTDFWGMALIGGLCTLLFYTLVIWAELNSIATVLEFDSHQTGKALESESEKTSRRARWREVFQFNFAYPSLLPAVWFRKQSKQKKSISPEKEDRKLWLDGLYLIKPLIIIESLQLKNAVARINDLVSKNLLRFDPELIKVKQIGRGIVLIALVAGITLGVFTGLSIMGDGIVTLTERLLSAGVGLIISSLITSIGVGLSIYLQTIYHTVIYRWMVTVVAAKGKRTSALTEPPKILSNVLNR